MNKKLVLILLCLTMFGTAFAQTDFTPSARSKATAGQFESDSDNVSANDIFSIDRAFFSAGYQPSLVLGNDNSMGKMTGFWAMPINDNMTIGIAGEYQMDATRRETSQFPNITTPTVPNSIYTTEELNEDSAFNIRPVFRFGSFAFSYRIYRSGSDSFNGNKTTIVPDGTEVKTNGSYNRGTIWEHEIGFAYQTDLFKFYVPIGAVIDMGLNNVEAYDAILVPDLTTSTKDKIDDTKIDLYINPQISFNVDIGPITEFETGINFKMAVFNPAGAHENIVTSSGNSITGAKIKENKTVISVADQSDILIGTYLQTTMEWTTWEDKIGFIFEPTLGLDYRYLNEGDQTTTVTTTTAAGAVTEIVDRPGESSYENIVTPYLEANIGAVMKFADWFEFRAGLYYGFNWENVNSTTSYELQGGGTISEYDYTFTSQFEVYSGFGFIFGEDFFIDVYIAAGNFIDDSGSGDFPVDPTSTTDRFNLFDIRNYGVQLSYRF